MMLHTDSDAERRVTHRLASQKAQQMGFAPRSAATGISRHRRR